MVPGRGPTVVTGATGFVGRALCAALPGHRALSLGAADWAERVAAAPLAGATIFHLAARAHGAARALQEQLLHDNAEKTRALAEAAASAGARRLVFLSTLKVHGEQSAGRAFRATDEARPQDAYARSKWQAECELRRIAADSRLEVAVVRSPLVVGPGARANLAALLSLARSPWPLPFAAIANRRTLVHVGDLVELLRSCATSPDAAGETFLAGHPMPVSTPSMVEALRRALGRPVRLFGVAPVALRAAAKLVGRDADMLRLTGNLEADVEPTMRSLGWSPRVEPLAALAEMARAGVDP